VVAVAVAALASAGPAAARPACPKDAPKGPNDPPCHPYLADAPYPIGHANTYSQHSTRSPGVTEEDEVTVVTGTVAAIPIGAIFSPRYPDGTRIVWGPGVSATADSQLYKINYDTGAIIDVYTRPTDEGSVPTQEAAISRTYGFLDRNNHVYRAAGAGIEVLADAVKGDPMSPIKLLKRWHLPPKAMCRANDHVVGMTLLYDGRLAFATNQGMVGVMPRRPKKMRPKNLIVFSINGRECKDSAVPEDALESVTNSISADERGGIYVLTDLAQHRIRARRHSLRELWRTRYSTGTAGGGGVRLDRGSGSTPALMGTRRGQDRMVVITDGQALMHMTLMWARGIPEDWKGLPGRPRRIACEEPLRFGDPNATESASEQSVVVRRYSTYAPNNQLRNTDLIQTLPLGQTPQMAIGGLAGQFPQVAPYGFSRIDWKPKQRKCVTRWTNTEVSIPNGVPFMSSGSRMVYGIGQRDGINGLEGMDMRTGESRLWVPAGPAFSQNAFYSALNIGPDGSMWTGGFNGFTKYAVGGS
jgi:hypothetical protein